jgi:hypothetical protein
MCLISAKSVVQIYLSLNQESRCRTFSLKVKRTAHNGNDVGSNPIQFISFNYFKQLKILNRASSSRGRAARLQRES